MVVAKAPRRFPLVTSPCVSLGNRDQSSLIYGRVMRPLLTSALVSFSIACSSTPPPSPAPNVTDAEGRTPDVACPGGPGCVDGEGTLLVGAAARRVTPIVEPFDDLDGDGNYDDDEPFEDLDGDGRFDPVWIAGFGRDRLATDVHDDLWARAIVFDRGDVRIAIVALDFVGFFHDDVVAIRRAARDRKLDLDQVIVVSTHQHEGPDTMGGWGPDAFTSGKDEDYMAFVVVQTADALEEAVAALEPATLHIGQSDASAWVTDSRRPMVIDPTLTVVQATGADVIATLVVFGNHPEVLGGRNTVVTSDFPHYLREAIEERWGGTAVFVPGTLGGLMNPLGLPGDNGTFEKAEWLGKGLADHVEDALEAPSVEANAALAFKRHSFLLRVENGLFVTGFFAGVLQRSVYGRDGNRLNAEESADVSFADAIDGGLRLQTEVATMSIGPLEMLFVPGEIYPELWLERPDGRSFVEQPAGADRAGARIDEPLVRSLRDAPFKAIVNQANDALGYIIPEAQYDRDPPFAYDPDGQYGEENSLGAHAAGAIHEAVQAVVAR